MEENFKQKNRGIKIIALILLIFILVLAFSDNNFLSVYFKEKKAWRNAVKENTYYAYEKFISGYPTAGNINKAKDKQDDALWSSAMQRRDVKTLNDYVKIYAEGKHTKEAQYLLDSMFWNNCCKTLTIDSVNSYLTRFPEGKYAKEAVIRIIETTDQNTLFDRLVIK